MSSILVEVPTDSRTCRHEDVEELGRDDAATYFRCVTCGSIMIVKSGHRWIIRPSDVEGPLPF